MQRKRVTVASTGYPVPEPRETFLENGMLQARYRVRASDCSCRRTNRLAVSCTLGSRYCTRLFAWSRASGVLFYEIHSLAAGFLYGTAAFGTRLQPRPVPKNLQPWAAKDVDVVNIENNY